MEMSDWTYLPLGWCSASASNSLLHPGDAAMGAAEAEELARRGRLPYHVRTERREQRFKLSGLETCDNRQHQILVVQFLRHRTILPRLADKCLPVECLEKLSGDLRESPSQVQ
jgi:hypothetical protein